jgi:hypothetical protein
VGLGWAQSGGRLGRAAGSNCAGAWEGFRARKRELTLSRLRGPVSRLLAQSLGVASPLVGELEEQSAPCGVVGRFGGASAFLRVLLVEASERHGSSSIQVRGGPTTYPAGHPIGVSRDGTAGFSVGRGLLSILDEG